jgi:cytoskeletal protein RodZ
VTLGQVLRIRREELGKSIDQLSAATKIHAKVLKAFEADLYAELPARTFTRGFLVSYCRALKLDSDQILREYHDFLELKFAERTDRDQGHQGYVFEGKELEQNRRWLIVGGSIVGIFAVATLLIFKPQNQKRKDKHKEFAEETPALVDVREGEDPEHPISAGPISLPQNTGQAISSLSPSSSPLSSPATAPLAPSPVSVSSVSAPAILAKASASPKPINSLQITASPSSVGPKPVASPSPQPEKASEKPDLLNKGDNLTPTEAKKKLKLQATDDVWVRFQIDEKPATLMILRKGRYLVIKAKNKISFETNHPEFLNYATRNVAMSTLTESKFGTELDGSLKPLENGLGAKALPETIPASSHASPSPKP